MPPAARRKAAKAAKGAKRIRAYDRTWRAARALLGQDKADAVSGRLFLDDIETDNGRARVVRTRGAWPIAAQWKAPTFIMSATLPRLEILQVSYPTVEVLADIDATMPHVEIRQVLGAPVSSKKLGILKIKGQSPKIEPPEGNRVIRDLRRAILLSSPRARSGADARHYPTGAEVEMLAEGVWLESPDDMAKCWPGVWPTAEAARDCLKARTNTTSGESPIWNSTVYKTFPRLLDGTSFPAAGRSGEPPGSICPSFLIRKLGSPNGSVPSRASSSRPLVLKPENHID